MVLVLVLSGQRSESCRKRYAATGRLALSATHIVSTYGVLAGSQLLMLTRDCLHRPVIEVLTCELSQPRAMDTFMLALALAASLHPMSVSC